MAVLIRDKPPTYDWGWFAREDPRMHLQAVDKDHRHLGYKVWLEEKGHKAFLPAPDLAAKVVRALQSEVVKQRSRIEAYWVAFMIKVGWLTAKLEGDSIVLTAYGNTPNRFQRRIKLADVLANHEVSRKIAPRDIALNEEYGVLEFFPQRDEAGRIHVRLEDVLWPAT